MAIRLGKMKINRLWLLVAMALVLGLLATWLSVTYLRNREQAIQTELSERAKGGQTITVVVPTQDLPKGAILREGVVAGREIQADLVYADTITVDQFDSINGKPLLAPVQRGRPLMRAQVFDDRPTEFSSTVTNGMRALTVEIDEINSIAQMLRPGDFVDLHLITADTSAPSGQPGQQIFPFLQRVKVIATGRDTDAIAHAGPRDINSQFSTVTVEVTPHEAAAIALAQTTGRIRTTLRSPDDKAIASFGNVTTAQLVGGPLKPPGGRGGSATPRPPARVEYIVGGSAGGGAAAPISISIPGLSGIPGIGQPAPGATGGAPAPAGAGSVTINGMPNSVNQAVNNASVPAAR